MKKISEFIKQLEEIKSEHGDIPVQVFNPENLVQGDLLEEEAFFVLQEDIEENVLGVTIVDKETSSSFY